MGRSLNRKRKHLWINKEDALVIARELVWFGETILLAMLMGGRGYTLYIPRRNWLDMDTTVDYEIPGHPIRMINILISKELGSRYNL